MKTLYVGVLLIAFYFTVKIDATYKQACCDCPYKAPNVSSGKVHQTYRDLVEQIWNGPEFLTTLTDLGMEFQEKILEVVDGSGSPASRLGVLVSYMFLRILPFLDTKPDSCGMARVINASVACSKGNGAGMNEALDLYSYFMLYFNGLIGTVSRFSSGCDGWSCNNASLNPAFPKSSCYKNGYGYDVNGIWDTAKVDNDEQLSEIRDIVKRMYASPVYSDKFFAVLASYPMTPSFGRLFDKTDPNIIIESITLQLSGKIQQCCCYQRIKRIDGLYKRYEDDIKLHVANERKYIATKKCPV